MPEVGSIVDALGGIGAVDSSPGGALGKDEFLRLLTTQLSAQDPLDPMDSTAMVSQLAQFSALEQMENLNSQFTSARKEDSVMQSLLLAGEPVKVTMKDGSEVEGTVDKVQWNNDGILLVIDEAPYPLESIGSIERTSPVTITE